MTYKLEDSAEGYQPNLSLFTPKPTDVGVDGIQWISFRPVTLITYGAPIEFNIAGTSLEYIDLSKTRLHVKTRILKKDGSLCTSDDNVGFINLPLQSLFR